MRIYLPPSALLGLSLLLPSCSSDEPATTGGPTSVATLPEGENDDSLGEITVETPSNELDLELDEDAHPWMMIATVAEGLEDETLGELVYDLLTNRMAKQKAEDAEIKTAVIAIESQMVDGCQARSLEPLFATLSRVEALSLANDRVALDEALNLVGAEGRSFIWDVAEPETTLPKPRVGMARHLRKSLPENIALSDDPAQAMNLKRMLLQADFGQEASQISFEGKLANLEAVINETDPETTEATGNIVGALEQIDNALIEGQEEKLIRAVAFCNAVASGVWLDLLEAGKVRDYIGRLGGTTGTSTARSSGKKGKGNGAGGESSNNAKGSNAKGSNAKGSKAKTGKNMSNNSSQGSSTLTAGSMGGGLANAGQNRTQTMGNTSMGGTGQGMQNQGMQTQNQGMQNQGMQTQGQNSLLGQLGVNTTQSVGNQGRTMGNQGMQTQNQGMQNQGMQTQNQGMQNQGMQTQNQGTQNQGTQNQGTQNQGQGTPGMPPQNNSQ